MNRKLAHHWLCGLAASHFALPIATDAAVSILQQGREGYAGVAEGFGATAWLRFALDGVLRDITLSSARLEIYGRGSEFASEKIKVCRAVAAWDSSAPTPAGDSIGALTVAGKAGWISLDVTPSLKAWMERRVTNGGFIFKTASASPSGPWVGSSDPDSSLRPMLILEYLPLTQGIANAAQVQPDAIRLCMCLRGRLTLRTGEPGFLPARWELRRLDGELVPLPPGQASSSDLNFDLRSYRKGIYLVVLTDKVGNRVSRLIRND